MIPTASRTRRARCRRTPWLERSLGVDGFRRAEDHAAVVERRPDEVPVAAVGVDPCLTPPRGLVEDRDAHATESIVAERLEPFDHDHIVELACDGVHAVAIVPVALPLADPEVERARVHAREPRPGCGSMFPEDCRWLWEERSAAAGAATTAATAPCGRGRADSARGAGDARGEDGEAPAHPVAAARRALEGRVDRAHRTPLLERLLAAEADVLVGGHVQQDSGRKRLRASCHENELVRPDMRWPTAAAASITWRPRRGRSRVGTR